VVAGAGKELPAGLAAQDCAVLLLQQRAQLVLVELIHQCACAAAAAAAATAVGVALAVLWITVCWAVSKRLLWLLLLMVGLVQRFQCLFLNSLYTQTQDSRTTRTDGPAGP
jgi:hypothetical protein